MDSKAPDLIRVRFDVTGIVQGVGFRPFVARLAAAHRLNGWVTNCAGHVRIEIEGRPDAAEAFERALNTPPAPCRVDRVLRTGLPPDGATQFRIADSDATGAGTPTLLPDTVTCPECLAEMRDPANRRYRYPFISCARCGPRYSLVETQPFDRERTALRDFPMCPACASEYGDIADRRFHAQTITCPACGPEIRLVAMGGENLALRHAAVTAAVARLRRGEIVALKGLGGFQLLVDATNAEAVGRLRIGKRRPAKPLAVMVPDLDIARGIATIDDAARAALTDRAGAIVLLVRRSDASASPVADNVAPDIPTLGLMLPSSGLHALLLDAFAGPLVVTSGNHSGLPIAIDNDEAMRTLAGVADCMLIHDRRITHRLDDSVLQIIAGQPQLLRRARGLVPLTLPLSSRRGVLACGSHQKNTVALALGDVAVMSQHNGDLDSIEARAQHAAVTTELLSLLGEPPSAVVVDANADYASTLAGHALADQSGCACVPVWHHIAHVHATIAEHGIPLPCTGFAWDGSGWGGGRIVRGGECFVMRTAGVERIASLLPFPLPGGDRAADESRRSALGLLYALEGSAATTRPEIRASFDDIALNALKTMLQTGARCPLTSSVGRLFDAVAFLLDVRRTNAFEGDAAMQLQFAAERAGPAAPFNFALSQGQLDWRPMLREMLVLRDAGESVATLAARFHATLVGMALRVAERAAIRRIALSGGCFQNRLLLESCIHALQQAGFEVFWPARVPANDGGLALGQLAAAHFGHLSACESPIEET